MTRRHDLPTYRPPSVVRRRLVNPVVRWLVLRGVGRGARQNLLRMLRVRGRTSGRWYEVPVRVAVRDGHQYVVSLLGQTAWAQNLRAAGSAQLLLGREVREVIADELPLAEKIDFIHWYCTLPEHGLSVRAGLKLDPSDPEPDALAAAAERCPIFRLDPAPPSRNAGAAE